jgi:hypothetical protein
MSGLESWFGGLHIFFKCAIILLSLPFIFTLVGALIFMMESPGESFWGENPSWWEQVLATTVMGFIGSILLGSIFGLTWLLNLVFALFHAGSWSGTVSFILALILVLGAVVWWFEFRAPEGHQEHRQ